MTTAISGRLARSILASSRGTNTAFLRPIVASGRCLSCPPPRAFSTSPLRPKKGGKSNKSMARSDSTPPVDPNTATPTPVDDAFDVSELEARILKAMERLTHELSLLRQGGKLNPDLLLKLDVAIGTAASKEKVKLADIAQVVPRGRIMNVIVGEQEYVKAVTNAIRASGHNLNPEQPKAENPMTIPVPLPPPTGESRKQTVEQARSLGRDAEGAVQAARQGHHKKLRKMELDKVVRPDDLKKANKQMEDVVKKGKEDIKRIVDGAVKVLDQH